MNGKDYYLSKCVPYKDAVLISESETAGVS
jgi:hypothetical protein